MGGAIRALLDLRPGWRDREAREQDRIREAADAARTPGTRRGRIVGKRARELNEKRDLS